MTFQLCLWERVKEAGAAALETFAAKGAIYSHAYIYLCIDTYLSSIYQYCGRWSNVHECLCKRYTDDIIVEHHDYTLIIVVLYIIGINVNGFVASRDC